MVIGFALLAWCMHQTPEGLIPIFAESSQLLPRPGEKMRLAVLWRNSMESETNSVDDASVVMYTTDPWSSPTSGGLLDYAAAQAASDLYQGCEKGLSIFTTFTGPEERSIVGEGAVAADGTKTEAWSLWNPDRIKWAATKMGSVNRTMRDLSYVSIGIYGDFGNSGFFSGTLGQSSALQKQFLERGFKNPPSLNWWCSDSTAIASWKKRLEEKHGSIAKAYADWGMQEPAPDAKTFPITADFPYSARLEFVDWYRDSISNSISALSDVAGEVFKKSQVMVPIGFATDFAQQGHDPYLNAEAIQSAGCIKATSLCFYDFISDWVISLGRIRAAAKATNKAVWGEAGSAETARASQAIFEAVALGAAGVSLFPEQLSQPRDPNQMFRVAQPRCDVAVLYPSSSQSLRPQQAIPALYFRGASELRDYLDFDVLDESAVMAGALSNYRVAVLFEGSVWRAKALQQIKSFVADGGVLSCYDFGKMSDPQGSTAVYQDLFGYAAQLTPFSSSERWKGMIPPHYSLVLGDPITESLLQGKWGSSSTGGREVNSGSEVFIPVRTQADVTLTLVFDEPKEAISDVEILIGGKKQALISVGPSATRFQIVIDRSQCVSGQLVVAMNLPDSAPPLILKQLEVAADQNAPVSALTGGFESSVSVEQTKAWTRNYGKGLTLFAPVKKEAWREYVAAIRNIVYRLSKIDPNRTDARNLDDIRDGVFACDLGDSFVLFNSNSVAISKPEPSVIELQANEVKVFRVASEQPPLILDAISFDTIGKGAAPDAQEREALRIPANTPVTTTVPIKRSGNYKVFVRATHNGAPATCTITIGEVELGQPSPPVRNSLFSFAGELQLPVGNIRIKLESHVDIKAYQIVLDANKFVAGYRIAKK